LTPVAQRRPVSRLNAITFPARLGVAVWESVPMADPYPPGPMKIPLAPFGNGSSLCAFTPIRLPPRMTRPDSAKIPLMVEEFYDEFVEVLARKGLFPPYGRGVPRSLFKCLYPKGLLLPLQVKDPDGQVIATCLFPHD